MFDMVPARLSSSWLTESLDDDRLGFAPEESLLVAALSQLFG